MEPSQPHQTAKVQRELATKLSAKKAALTQGDAGVAAAVDSELTDLFRYPGCRGLAEAAWWEGENIHVARTSLF